MDAGEELQRVLSELKERRERTLSSATVKGLFFNQYLDEWERLGGRALRDRCAEIIGEPVHALYEYPYQTMLKLGEVAVPALAEQSGGALAFLRETGRVATRGYLASPLGRAFLTLVPSAKMLMRMLPWAIGTVFSFGKREMVFDGPTSGVFQCRFDYSPAECNAGAIEAALTAMGVEEFEVTVSMFDLFNYDLVVRWEE